MRIRSLTKVHRALNVAFYHNLFAQTFEIKLLAHLSTRTAAVRARGARVGIGRPNDVAATTIGCQMCVVNRSRN